MSKLENIILIDDDEATNYYNILIIKESGIKARVESFFYVKEALDYFHSIMGAEGSVNNEPGVIFLDINMPGMNGWDFLDEYSRLHPGDREKLIVVILSTSENPGDRVKGMQYPVVKDYLIKPLTADMLLAVQERYFDI